MSYSLPGIEAARRSFDGTELLKRADLVGSKRNSAVAALQLMFLAQQLVVAKPNIGSSSESNLNPHSPDEGTNLSGPATVIG
jgi:hypothetical protein